MALSEKAAVDVTDPVAHRTLRGGEFWRHIPAYAEVSEEQFLDHKWQLKATVKSVEELLATIKDVVSPEVYEDARLGFQEAPMAVRVSPYVMSLIDWENPQSDPLRKQFIPFKSLAQADHPELHLDTLKEQEDSPVPGLTHRYPDKALFLALQTCPVYCRYCTRSYAVGPDTDDIEKKRLGREWGAVFKYISETPTLEDIVISGGDVYMLQPKHLLEIGEALLAIPHVRRMRFATKGPAIMPMKILSDNAWYEAIRTIAKKGRKMHKDVVLHTHFSHPGEITEISQRAMNRFFEDGIRVRNQAVLQRGVNDDAETMKLMVRRLAYINVQPYYVYVHDLVQGVEELRTTVQTAIDIEKAVRGSLAGFNTPTFVVDAPGGGGKRDCHSYEHYNRETGISVYTAPSIKPGQFFMYYDPIDTLAPDIQAAWRDDKKREEMKQAALEAARRGDH